MIRDCVACCETTTTVQRLALVLLAAILSGLGVLTQYTVSTAAYAAAAYFLAILLFTALYHCFLTVFTDTALTDTLLAVVTGATSIATGFLILGLAGLYQPLLFLGGIVFVFSLILGCAVTARLFMVTAELDMAESLLTVLLVKAIVVLVYGTAFLASAALQTPSPTPGP